MKVRNTLQRVKFGASSALLFLAALAPALTTQVAHALPAGVQVTSRQIKMSSSEVSATANYEVSFNLGTAHANLEAIVVDFCDGSDTPIIGDAACAKPAGFTVGASPTITLGSGISGGTWVSGATSANSGRTLKISDSTGNNLAANATVSFTITGVTNPSDTDDGTAGNQVGTFYARIITYNDSSHADFTGYAAGAEGNTAAIDYGGIALSLANQLTITAKVQEQLTFCVYTTGANCSGASGTSVALGNANGVLSNYGTNYTDTTSKFNIASNAQGGVVVRMKGANLCRTSSNCGDGNTGNIINPSTTSGNMSCTADSATTSVEQFGMRVSTLGSGVTATAPFNCAANNHGFDTNTTNGTGSTYGATVASTAGPSDEVASTMEFMAKAATTTEAGIYTTDLTFIATGTY